jgi:hypothetical protein
LSLAAFIASQTTHHRVPHAVAAVGRPHPPICEKYRSRFSSLTSTHQQFETSTPHVAERPNGESHRMATLPESTFGVRIQIVENHYR